MALALYGTVLTGGDRLDRQRVVIDGERIASVTPADRPQSGDTVVDDGWIAPGLIDLHVHGAAGVDLSSALDPAAALRAVAAALVRRGVTAFCPTIVSSRPDAYVPLLRAFTPRADTGGAASLGAHLEGPFLNVERRGAHDPAMLRRASTSEIARWLEAAPPAIVTLAPELPGGMNALRQLAAAGVVVSLGHSMADARQARAALEAGATRATHLFNAMPPFHHRTPGLAGALLASDAYLEVIADGVHLDPDAVQLAIRTAGPQRVTLVTDGLAPAGMPPGRMTLGDQAVTSDGRAVRRDDGVLAGSALTLDECLRNVARWMPSLPAAHAVAMATSTPAASLGREVAARKGRIAAGYDADLVVFDSEWHVMTTYVRGRLVS